MSAAFSYPEQLAIQPYAGRGLSATVTVPGSKSITNRALVLAALSSRQGPCALHGALHSEDTEVMVDSLQRLGFSVATDWAAQTIGLGANASGRIIPAERAELFVANSGTSMRFLSAMVSIGNGCYRLDGVPRMRERPIQDLIDALAGLGVDATAEGPHGCPPVVVDARGWGRSTSNLRMNLSSQFLSGLMLAAPFAGLPAVEIFFEDIVVSRPYLDMTVAVLRAWGVETEFTSHTRSFRVVAASPPPHLEHFTIEPDASAASYFFGAAAILGGSATVTGLHKTSLQGDVDFISVLQRMGCTILHTDAGITVYGHPLRGVDVDMNAISDTVMTLAAVACFAANPTRIRNVAHIRHKETDRIAALATELRRLGVEVEESADGLTIIPRPMHGALVETYNDHRLAMSLALIGLKVPGVVINNPGCVAKTYPGYWRDLTSALT